MQTLYGGLGAAVISLFVLNRRDSRRKCNSEFRTHHVREAQGDKPVTRKSARLLSEYKLGKNKAA